MATELFSNNARGVLAESIGPSNGEIILESGVESFSSPPNSASWSENGGYFQRATIYHPDDPDHNEIVFITDIDKYSNVLTVSRSQESNDGPSAWPAGSIIEARVTAGMLKSLSEKTDAIDDETGFPYLTKVTKVPENSYPSSETPMFASMMTGRSVNVSLGTPTKSWGFQAIDKGEIVTHPGAPNAYFVALDWWQNEQKLPELPDPQEGVAESGVVVLESNAETPCRFYAQRTDEPITIQLNDGGIGMVVTEVGFVSIQNSGAGPAQISVSVGGVQLVQSTPIDEPAGSVVRFFNQSQRLAPTDSIQVDVLTRSTGKMRGYFYWVGFSAGPVLP